VPDVDQAELRKLVGTKRAAVLSERIASAAGAFSRDRFPDAQRMLRPIATEVPQSAVVRELYGLTLYRLGRYKAAAAELEAFVDLTGNSTEQHPVLADCYRALKRYKRIDELWEELREASPSAELVTEGRIVVAGSLADRGRLADAVRLLDKGWKPPRRPAEHHLRRAYALGDLFERAGDLPRARATFGWLAIVEPDFADVADRVNGLR
jgi:tetratricopeptide (TPR) repeat protein